MAMRLVEMNKHLKGFELQNVFCIV